MQPSNVHPETMRKTQAANAHRCHDLYHGWTADISQDGNGCPLMVIRHDSGERIELSEGSILRLREILAQASV